MASDDHRPVKTLEISYRHLQGIILHDLAELNVIIGANNVGKTTLLRALRAQTGHDIPDRDRAKVNEGYDFLADQEQEIARCYGSDYRMLESSRAAIARCSTNGSQIWGPRDALERLIWNGRNYYFHYDTKEPSLYRKEPELPKNRRHAGVDVDSLAVRVFHTSVEKNERRDHYPHSSIENPNIIRLRPTPSHYSWLQQSFFLWHRRKSSYLDDMGICPRLDPDAQHLAGRLHQLRAERQRDFHQRLTQFIEAVIPGLGEPVTRLVERASDGQRIKPARYYRERDMERPEPDLPGVEIVFSGPPERTLENLGGGVEQVLALGLVLLGEPDDGALFIEEPESHLHPDAQRRLLQQVLRHRGQRQIFITTHSPVFIDAFDGRGHVYRIYRDADGQGHVESCLRPGPRRRALDDLGARASQLLQSNCVIWVEGPTESVLMRAWLGWLAPELHEHRHYEFAYTGGSLLAHLGADVDHGGDGDGDDLRDLFRLCRYNAVLCDRDAAPGARAAKPDVRRLRELAATPDLRDHLHLWVTHSYEVEWYLPQAVIAQLWSDAAAAHVADSPLAGRRPFYEVLRGSRVRGTKSAEQRKVRYARQAVELPLSPTERAADDHPWWTGPTGEHLREQLLRLADFIRRANGSGSQPRRSS